MRLVVAAATVLALAATTRVARADDDCQLNPLDCLAVDQFSATADATSDAFFLTSLVLPVAMELGRGIDDDSLERGLAYGGAVGATAIAAGLTKIIVRRPRPYTYSRDPKLQAFTRTAHGNEHSFFSGHTSLAFAAVTSGAVLHGSQVDRESSRLAIWAVGGALAASTGVLRIRAGKHFPTDVVTGAVVGTIAGVTATLVIAPDTDMTWKDATALAGGVAVGALVTSFVPMPRDVILPLGGSGGVVVEGPIGIMPVTMPGGGLGLTLSAQMR